MRAKKHLGQHFLRSTRALDTMVRAARVSPKDTVLEIGPGTGALTGALLRAGATVIAVEKDAELIPVLREMFAREIADGALTLVEGDVLDTDARDLAPQPYKLVANIPYYITGEILRRFLSASHAPASMTLLVQKEVAERIARSPKESILSLSVKAYGTPRYVATVPARHFSPPPNVDSAIVHIDDISTRFFVAPCTEERFFTVIKAGFGSKRKQLVNNLAAFGSKEALRETLRGAGLREDARAEDVPLETWKTLIELLDDDASR